MGESELFEAVKTGNADRVENLLKRPAAAKELQKMYDGESETMMTCAARCRNPKVIHLLHKAGADVNKRNYSGKSPLHLSSYEGDAATTKALIDCGADVNLPDDTGKLALHWAVEKNRWQVIRVLVQGGANVNLKTTTGVSILHGALSKGNAQTIEELVKNGANLLAVNHQLDTVLMSTIKLGREDVLEVLLKEGGVSVDSVTEKGETLLHLAALANKHSIAKYLLDKCDVDCNFINTKIKEGETKIRTQTVDVSGMTALHIAVTFGNVKFVQILLDKGADNTVQSSTGKTPAAIARGLKQDDILVILEGGAAKNRTGMKGAGEPKLKKSVSAPTVTIPRARKVSNRSETGLWRNK